MSDQRGRDGRPASVPRRSFLRHIHAEAGRVSGAFIRHVPCDIVAAGFVMPKFSCEKCYDDFDGDDLDACPRCHRYLCEDCWGSAVKRCIDCSEAA